MGVRALLAAGAGTSRLLPVAAAGQWCADTEPMTSTAPRLRRHRLARAVAGVAVAVALTGCEADVATRITVESADETTIVTQVTLAGEAAEAALEDPASENEMVTLFQDRLGVAPTRDEDAGTLTWTAEVAYDRLVDAQQIHGVSSAVVGPRADGTGTALTVTLVEPAQLTEAIISSTVGQDDAEAMAAAMLGTMTVTVAVDFAGGTGDATFSGTAPVERVDGTAVLAQDLDGFEAGTFVVEGSTERAWYQHRLVIPAIVIALVGGLVAWITRPARPAGRPRRS